MASHVRGASVGVDEPRTVLPYGEVRLGPGFLAIGVESVPHASAVVRSIYERAVAAAGVDASDVLVVRVGEGSIEVDAIDADVSDWPVRTWFVTPAQLRDRAPASPQGRSSAWASPMRRPPGPRT